MATTIMKDSGIGDDWIKDACRLNPVQRVIDPKTGQPNGNILTGPVRLAFCDPLFTPKKPMGRENDPTAKGKYGTMALYTPFTDFTILYEEYYKALAAGFASYYNQQVGNYVGLETPFRDQVVKSKFAGMTPGCTFMTHNSNYIPQIVDTRNNIITDPAKVYAGVWAILAINAYGYGVSPPQPKKGVAFGLQQVMIIADDTRLAGGPPDPRMTFAGVNVKPPAVAPAGAFGQMAPPPGGMPPMQPPGAPPIGNMPPPPVAVATDEDLSDFV